MKNFIKQLIDNNINQDLIKKLSTLLSNVNGNFYIINSKNNLFKFPYLLYIPNKFESNTLILHGNNLAQEENNIMNIYSAIFETTSDFNFRHTDDDIRLIYQKVFGNDYQSRFDQLVRIYQNLNFSNVSKSGFTISISNPYFF